MYVSDTFEEAEKDLIEKRRRHPRLNESAYNISMQKTRIKKATSKVHNLGKELKNQQKVSFMKMLQPIFFNKSSQMDE